MAEYAIDIADPVPLSELIRRAADREEVILTEGESQWRDSWQSAVMTKRP